MSHNVPVLAVLVLLCAPGLVWSEEPLFSNIPRIGSSYQGAGTDGMQDRNTRSSFTNSVPVYSMSNRPYAYGSVPETFHDFQSYHRSEPQLIPSFVVRPSQTARFMTSLPHGISPTEIDGTNPPGINSALSDSSPDQMIPSLAATEQGIPSDPPLSGRDPLNKIPIYVIRPPFSGMASPTIVSLAVLPQEQINPEIIRILQSLRLSQDRVPLVLVAGQYPSPTAESGINTMDIDDSTEGRLKPIMGMMAPHPLSDEEWDDEEIMKHGTLIHGRRPPIFPNIGRFVKVSPQLNTKPGIPPLDYRLRNPEGPQNIVPMNAERFAVPRERNVPAGFMPSQQSTLPIIIMPQKYYPPTKDRVRTDLSDSQRYQPIHPTIIPEYLIQHPQFPRRFKPNLQQKPDYISKDDTDDSLGRQQYLTYPSSDVEESHISSYPSQQNIYARPYNQQTPYNFQTPTSPEFPSSDGRAPSVHDGPEVIAQMGRLTIPENPSQYSLVYPENFTGYIIPKQFYPGQQAIYPFIQKVPQDQLEQLAYPYSPDAEVSNTPERSYLSPQYKYPEYPPRDSEDLGSYPDLQPVYPSQSSRFPPHSPPPSVNVYHPLPQYPFINKQLPIQPRPNIHARIDELIIPDIQEQVPPDSYSQFPSASQYVPDYHSPSPDRYYPDQKPMYPSGIHINVPISHPILPTPSIHTYDDGKPNLQSTPDILSQIDPLNIPQASPEPQIKFPQLDKVSHPALNPDGSSSQHIPGQQLQYPFESPRPDYQVPQEDARYPSTGTDGSTGNVNTLDLPYNEQLELPSGSPDDQLSKYPKKDTDEEPSKSPMPEVNSSMEKFIPEKLHPSTQHKYPQFPSADYDGPTEYPDAGPQKPYKETHPDSPYDGQIRHYPRQPLDDTEPQAEARTEIVSNIEKFSMPERGHPAPLPKYPQAPSSDFDEPTYYPDAGPQKPYKETHPDSPYDGQIRHYPRQPMDDTEPQVEAGTETVSDIHKFSIPERGHLAPLPKYPQAASSDFDEPTYYPYAGPKKPHKETHPNSLYDDQIRHYPRAPMDDTEPQVEARTEIVSNIEKFSIPERGHPAPLPKYPQAPSSDFDEPTYYSDTIHRQPYRGTDPEFPFQVTDYPRHPTDDTQSPIEPKTDVVTKVEKFIIPEPLHLKPHHQSSSYLHGPSSDTDALNFYPDSGTRHPYRGIHPDFPYNGQVTYYPKQLMDDTIPGMKPRTEVVSKIEQLSIPGQMNPIPQQTYPQAPSADTHEPTYYPYSGQIQRYTGAHPDSPYNQVTYYSKHPTNDREPQMRPRPDIFSKLEQFSIPEQPYTMPQQKYLPIPSSYADEPVYNSGSSPRQPYKETHPSEFPYDEQVKGYPVQPMDYTKPLIRPNLDVASTIEEFIIPDQAFPKPQHEYPLIPSSNTGEPGFYPDSSPQQPYGGQHPDFSTHGQYGGYSKELVDGKKPELRPIPGVISNTERLNIPEQTLPSQQQKVQKFPFVTEEPKHYPEIGPLGSDVGLYPDFPAHGQIPAGFPEQPIDRSDQSMRPRPVFVSELKKLNTLEEPDTIPQQTYPQYPSSDNDDTRKTPDRDPNSYTDQKPESPSDGQTSGYQKYPYGHEEPSSRHRPETGSEIKKFYIPEHYNLEPQEGYPRYPSSDTDETIYQPGSGIQQPYGTNPESDGRIPGYYKRPFKSAEPTSRWPEMVSEIRKFSIPEDSSPVKKHPQYPSTGEAAPQMFPDEGIKPSFSEEQAWFPSDENTPGQLHQPQPSTHYENLHIPDAPLQVERIYITGRPPAEQMEEYQLYPSTGTADEHTGYLDTIPKSQYPPSKQPILDFSGQIGRIMVPKLQYTDQQPQWPNEGAVPTDHPDQYFPQYPSSFNKPTIMRPINDPQTRKIEVPKSSSTGVEPQYLGMQQPELDNQLPNLIPKFPIDISVPTDQAQRVFSQYPSFEERRIPGIPGIVSQIGVFKIPETPGMRIQQEYPQYPSSDTKNPLLQLDTPQQVPSDQQQQPSSLIHHPVQDSPKQPPFNNMGPFLLPKPDFTARIGRINIPEPGQDPNTFPLNIPDAPIRQPDMYTTDIPNQRNVQYPSSDDQVRFPDQTFPFASPSYVASTSSPVNPKTSDRIVEPEKQVYPKKDHISPTLDMIANVERFKISQGPRFKPPGQGHTQYLQADGTLLQPDTQSGLKLRESNDIDLNIERLTVPGQISWQPGQRYPQYAAPDTQELYEYPETYSLYPHHITQTQMKPDNHLPVGGERLPENPDQYSSSSPYKPHQHPLFPYSPKEQPEWKYQEYPNGDTIDFLSSQPQPRVTVDAERVSQPRRPHLLPMHGYFQHPSAGDEPARRFLDHGAQHPPERQFPRDHELLPSIHSFADQGFPKKQLQPDIQMRMEIFEVTEPPGSSPVDERFQNFYTTSTPSTTQPPQYYPSPNYPSPNYPDFLQPQIIVPYDQTKTDIPLPVGRQVQSLTYLKTFPDSTTPSRPLDISEDKSYSDVEIEKIKQGSPSVASRYPVSMIEISNVMQPHQYQLIHPNFIEPQIYGSDQYPDSQYPHSLDYPGNSSLPQTIPPDTWEGYPVNGYSPDGPRQQTISHPTFHHDGKEPQYYPLDQTNYPHGLTPGHPSSASSPVEEPKHLKNPTVYVYPVPRRQEIPQSYAPHLENNLSGPPQPEPFSYSPGTHDYQAPIDAQTQVYPQPDPHGTSPRVLQYETTPEQPDDFPQDLSRSIQGQLKTPGSTTQLPGTDERHDLDQQTSIKGYVDETSSMPSIQTQHTTSIYSESMPSQPDVSRISPAETMLHTQPSAEQIVVSPTLTYPVEQQNPPSTTTINYPNPLESNQFILNGSVFEGMPDQRLVPDGSAPQVPPSPQDIPRTELPNGQATSPEEVQPAEGPTSVNTLDFPYSTEGAKAPDEHEPVSSGSTTIPSEELENGFYHDEALTTTTQSTGVGSAPDEPSIIPSSLVPQAVPSRKQILPEPSSGVTNLPTPSSTSIGSFPVPPDSPQIPTGPSLLPDSKITRIFPATKPTFYTDKEGQNFVSLKLINEPISTSPTGDIIPSELTDSPQNPGTTDLVIPIGRDVSDSLPQNATQPHPMLKGIPISNVQVFDAQTIIKVIESCNCSNLKFLIPILKRPQSAIVVANSEYPGIAN